MPEFQDFVFENAPRLRVALRRRVGQLHRPEVRCVLLLLALLLSYWHCCSGCCSRCFFLCCGWLLRCCCCRCRQLPLLLPPLLLTPLLLLLLPLQNRGLMHFEHFSILHRPEVAPAVALVVQARARPSVHTHGSVQYIVMLPPPRDSLLPPGSCPSCCCCCY